MVYLQEELMRRKCKARQKNVLSRGRKVSEHLQTGHDEEKNVGEALELLEQSLGHEGDDGVLGGYHGVGRIVQFQMLFWLVKICESGGCLRCRSVLLHSWADLDDRFR